MSRISNNDIARAIYLGAKDKQNGELSLYYKNAAKFIFRKRLLSKSAQIFSNLRKIIDQEQGRVKVKVTSVEKLSEHTKEKLVQALKKRYLAKEVALEEKLDSRLIGGMKIEANNEVMDLSVKNKIGKLKEYLTKSA